MVTLTNALIMFAFGYVRALYNTFKHIYVEEGWPWGGVQKWLWVFFMNILTRTVNTNRDYEYQACSVHLLYSKAYTYSFPDPGCTQDCTKSL